MKKIVVDTETNSYDIIIKPGFLTEVNDSLDQVKIGATVVLITDTNVDPLYADGVTETIKSESRTVHKFVIEAGERSKQQQTINEIYAWMLDHNFSRDVTVVALGGGVIGDIAGFVAATYLRGVRFIQIPTTLLAQVDSSVGGKVGINHRRGKNVIGAFYQPQIVFIDPLVLQTLPKRELFCGMAEVIKYSLILDRQLFDILNSDFEKLIGLTDWALIEKVIARCCQLKAEVVNEDEKERGLRRILNFGHTIGHALESSSGYSHFNHGEAIAWGMLAAAHISRSRGLSQIPEQQQIESVINKIEKPAIPTSLDHETIFQSVATDKKMDDHGLNFILLDAIGKYRIELIDDTLLRGGIQYILEK